MKPRGRESLKDRIRRNAAAFEALRPPGVEVAPIYRTEPETVRAARVKARASSNPLESQVLQEILGYLESRGDIGGIVRTNSGIAQESSRFIRFNTCIGKHDGSYMTLLDLQCIHKPSGRHIECEVKRALWRYSGRANEVKQAARIAHLKGLGAVAFFATSVIEVQHELRKVGI